MAHRDPGFSHFIGALDCTVAVHNAPSRLVRALLPDSLEVRASPTAPDGTTPICVAYIRTNPSNWTLLPMAVVRVRAIALMVFNVHITGLRPGYQGPYTFVARWWSAKDWKVRLGSRLWGLPPDDVPVETGQDKLFSSVSVPGCVTLQTRDHGDIPEWPKVRQLAVQMQAPLLAVRPNGQLGVAGMNWNLADADMRSCEMTLTLRPGLWPSGAVPDSPVSCTMDGTRDMATGGTFRFGSICHLTHAGSPARDWSQWKAGPRFRLRADLSPIEVGPVAEKMRAAQVDS
ncbi:MAG: hypothetical protein FJ100_03385 [Deltaproteobacteria bacterium]|nr:hypothetical protein [Deltaproteobacteria bacterium]